ncbi:hypothetical protein LTR53_020555, partial [Teratosphaeriaceae sp. CCFEE 6253]
MEEGYFGKTQNKVIGVIYKCDVTKDRTMRIKDVKDDILARVDGTWTDKVYCSLGSADLKKVADKDKILLVDVNPMRPVAKT